MTESLLKCINCRNFVGDCGHHFVDGLGHVCYDVPRESEFDGRWATDGPACFEPNDELIKREREGKIRALVDDDSITIDILEAAIVRKSDMKTSIKGDN